MVSKIFVLELSQNNKVFYVGSMTAEQLVEYSRAAIFDSGKKTGYQRQIKPHRAAAFANFIRGKNNVSPTAIVLSYRGTKPIFTSITGDYGEITLPPSEQLFWQVDGQHRIAGLRQITDSFPQIAEAERIKKLKFPVILMCPGFWNTSSRRSDAGEFTELLQFLIINKTQKTVPTELAEQYLDIIRKRFNADEIKELPAIVVSGINWKPYAIKIVEELNNRSKIWSGKIQIANMSSHSGTYVNQKAFSDSLAPVFKSDLFPLDDDEDAKSTATKLLYRNLDNYWRAIFLVCPEAFTEHTEYVLFRRTGVFVMNKLFGYILLANYLNKSLDEEVTINEFKKLLDVIPMNSKQWSVKSDWGQMGTSHKAIDFMVDKLRTQLKSKYGR